MFLCYITDRRQLSGSGAEQREALLGKISQAARCGVDFIQLREKDLSAREFLCLAQEALARIAQHAARGTGNSRVVTRLTINSRLDVALAAGADGVHLRSDDISAADARAVSMAAGGARPLSSDRFLVACSCHTAEEVRRAEADGADLVVFAPVFEKSGEPGVGFEALRAACLGTPPARTPEPSPAIKVPVLALGGVTVENASACLEAGAAGIAGIRLFQDHDMEEVVAQLRKTDRPID
ncbi:MAG: thiamine phosphate synthase [Terriglobales bacterium]